MRSSPKTIAIDLKIRECSGSPPPRLCNLVKLKLKNAKKKNCEGESFELGIRNMMVTLINKSLPLTSWIISAEFAPFGVRLRDGERTCLYVREKIRTKSWKCTTMPQSSSKGKSVNGLLLLEVFFFLAGGTFPRCCFIFLCCFRLFFFRRSFGSQFSDTDTTGWEKHLRKRSPKSIQFTHSLVGGALLSIFHEIFTSWHA